MAGRTTFVIAHRLATVRNASRIFVLDQGRVWRAAVSMNWSREGVFASLAKAQFIAAEPSPV